jgi:hypothetical protein
LTLWRPVPLCNSHGEMTPYLAPVAPTLPLLPLLYTQLTGATRAREDEHKGKWTVGRNSLGFRSYSDFKCGFKKSEYLCIVVGVVAIVCPGRIEHQRIIFMIKIMIVMIILPK